MNAKKTGHTGWSIQKLIYTAMLAAVAGVADVAGIFRADDAAFYKIDFSDVRPSWPSL